MSQLPQSHCENADESVHRTLGTVCLVAYMYFVFASELVKILKPAEEEEEFLPLKKSVSLVSSKLDHVDSLASS